MALKSEKIIERYREDFNNFLFDLEPELDAYLLKNYTSLLINGYISISHHTLAWLIDLKVLPENIKFNLIDELNNTYTDWRIEERLDENFLYFYPPENFISDIKNTVPSTKKTDIEEKIKKEVEKRTDILDI